MFSNNQLSIRAPTKQPKIVELEGIINMDFDRNKTKQYRKPGISVHITITLTERGNALEIHKLCQISAN